MFDNRGVGNTDSPLVPFSMRTMADDAAAVLDAAGVDAAHVFGVSMGGMIAQELVLSHPGRVRKLVLGCTQCGGPLAEPPRPEIRRILSPLTISIARAQDRGSRALHLRLAYATRTHRS